MKRYLKFELALPLAALAMTLATSVFRTLAICLGYDPAVGYYQTGNSYVILANLLSILYVILALGLSVLSCFGKLTPSRDPRTARVTALVLGCGVALYCFDHLSVAVNVMGKMEVTLLLSVVTAFVGLSFSALTFLRVNTLEPVRALGALCLSLSFILHALCHYMSTDTPINGDLKILYMFAAISAAFLFLSEAKRSLYKQNGISGRFFSLCACMLCISVGMSEIFAFFFQKDAFSDNYTHPFLLLCVGAYAFARLFAARVPVITANDVEYAAEDQWDEEDEEATGEVTEVTPEKQEQ